jgi:predicted 3-demethylubiquinone-9 3-methyltransferase (glyoxalase superfamily)
MKKITPHLWFDKNAKEAAEFYIASFGGSSKLLSLTTLHDTPSGDCDIVTFELCGQSFQAISAGDLFKINPSISFILNFDMSDKKAEENLNALWKKFSVEGSKILMPLQEYPFSKLYGWIQDKFGVTWQLMLMGGHQRPFIVPAIMFIGSNSGKAEEATTFYRSVFKDSHEGVMAKDEKEGTVMFCDFMLEGQWFAAMDSGTTHDFNLNEAISLVVTCEGQEEMDYYWKLLSAVPESEQCGWIKDKYGLSWQIVPKAMGGMLKNGSKEQVDRLTQAFLPMKKLDIAALQAVYDQPQAANPAKRKGEELESEKTKKQKGDDKGTDELKQLGAQ